VILGNAVQWSLGGPCVPGLALLFLLPIAVLLVRSSFRKFTVLRKRLPSTPQQSQLAILEEWASYSGRSQNPTWADVRHFYEWLRRERSTLLTGSGGHVSRAMVAGLLDASVPSEGVAPN